ncbi:hypothetical protein ACOBV8_20930 (plasmid) [Pseudoalteromonas espejiana]
MNNHKALVELVTQKNDLPMGTYWPWLIYVGKYTKAIKLIEKALSFGKSIEYTAQLAKCYALTGELAKQKHGFSHTG